MIRIKALIILVLAGFFCSTVPAAAQFISLDINIEPELSVSVEQPLDFGLLTANTGRHSIALGDVNMGVFAVRAYRTQNIFLSVSFPDILTDQTGESADQIPVFLEAAYNNTGSDDPFGSLPLAEISGAVPVSTAGIAGTRQDPWQELFVYVFGAVDIGTIRSGVYTGQVILTVDFD